MGLQSASWDFSGCLAPPIQETPESYFKSPTTYFKVSVPSIFGGRSAPLSSLVTIFFFFFLRNPFKNSLVQQTILEEASEALIFSSGSRLALRIK